MKGTSRGSVKVVEVAVEAMTLNVMEEIDPMAGHEMGNLTTCRITS